MVSRNCGCIMCSSEDCGPVAYCTRVALMSPRGWQTQLADDVTPLLPEGTPVWLRADNAYYRGDLVRFCTDKGLGLLDQRDQ